MIMQEHFLMSFFLTIWTSSIEVALFSSFTHFLIGRWFLGSLYFRAPCVFCLLILCQTHSWQRFSAILWTASSFWWPFLLLFRSFLISCVPICQFFSWVAEPFEFYRGRHWLFLLISLFYLLFMLASKFQILLRSLIHFDLTLVQGDKHGSGFSFLQANNQFSRQHLLKRLTFLHHMF
jgi:hypothetical protein